MEKDNNVVSCSYRETEWKDSLCRFVSRNYSHKLQKWIILTISVSCRAPPSLFYRFRESLWHWFCEFVGFFFIYVLCLLFSAFVCLIRVILQWNFSDSCIDIVYWLSFAYLCVFFIRCSRWTFRFRWKESHREKWPEGRCSIAIANCAAFDPRSFVPVDRGGSNLE